MDCIILTFIRTVRTTGLHTLRGIHINQAIDGYKDQGIGTAHLEIDKADPDLFIFLSFFLPADFKVGKSAFHPYPAEQSSSAETG